MTRCLVFGGWWYICLLILLRSLLSPIRIRIRTVPPTHIHGSIEWRRLLRCSNGVHNAVPAKITVRVDTTVRVIIVDAHGLRPLVPRHTTAVHRLLVRSGCLARMSGCGRVPIPITAVTVGRPLPRSRLIIGVLLLLLRRNDEWGGGKVRVVADVIAISLTHVYAREVHYTVRRDRICARRSD
jgi:hypothetical protein